MKVCFVMIAFQSDWVLEPVLQAVQPFGKIVAAEGPVQYWQAQGYRTSTDRTNELLERYAAEIVHGQWAEKDQEAMAAFALVPPDTDVAWMVDADEVWEPETIRRVLDLMENCLVDSLAFSPYSFYGGFERVMGGFEEEFEWWRVFRWGPDAQLVGHRPPRVRRNGQIGGNQLSNAWTRAQGLRFFHYSYIFPEQIRAKTAYYHSWSGTIPHYFERVYLPWVRGDDVAKSKIEDEFDGVHDWLPARRGPCRTRAFRGALPEAIRQVLPQLQARFAQELEAYR